MPVEQLIDEVEAKVFRARDAFLEEMGQIDDLDQALHYIPNTVDSTALVMRYIDEEEIPGRKATNRLAIVNQIYLVELYCYGYDREEMQERFQRIVLRIRQRLRTNPTLGRAIKQSFEVRRLGDPQMVLINLGGSQQPLLRQQWRYSHQMEVRG